MSKKADDLHNILFEQLERLNDKNIKGVNLQDEIKRADAMAKVAGQIISNGNMVLNAIKISEQTGQEILDDMFVANANNTKPKLPAKLPNGKRALIDMSRKRDEA